MGKSSPEHAQKITDVKLKDDGSLSFKGAKREDGTYNEFEMKLFGGNEAKLKFMGTPVEKNPWHLFKQTS